MPRTSRAVDQTIANLMEVKVPAVASSKLKMPPIVAKEAPKFVHDVTAEIIAGRGDQLPVSKFPVDGTFPTATAQWEKRNIAMEIPVWNMDVCIQCNKCTMVCPHAAIRTKVAAPALLEKKPATFKSMKYKGKEFDGQEYIIQVAPEDCTGCKLCVEVCPGKDKKDPSRKALMMAPQMPSARRRERRETTRSSSTCPRWIAAWSRSTRSRARSSCSRCSSTRAPARVVARRRTTSCSPSSSGDRAIIANATGCSSIYGGNLPTTPFTQTKDAAAVPRGTTRCSRTTPSSVSATASPSTSRPSTPRCCSRSSAASCRASW